MTLTVDEIDRWDAAAVREVADAARTRAKAAADAAAGLADLPCLTCWGGRAADAARAAIGRTRRDLEAHAAEALAVADAAARAAGAIDDIHAKLRLLRIEAAVLGLRIDAPANRIAPLPGSVLPGMIQVVAVPVLQMKLNNTVQQANSVDAELARAVGLAGGAGLAPAPDAPPIAALPDDPAQFHALWQSLYRPQRDALYERDHGIGNHPGMPVGTDADPGSDFFNRRHLAEDLASARSSGAEHLSDLEALEQSLHGPQHLLMLYDPDGGEQVHAAVAVGNPDTATHVSVTTPGLNSTVGDSVGRMVTQAGALRRESLRQLGDAGKPGEDVAAVAWMGYDAPQITGIELTPILPGVTAVDPLSVARSQRGMYQVSHDDVAKAAAPNLARFYAGITAAHGGRPLNLTAIGHSYGSLTTGLALQSGDHGVRNAIFYGSPGIEATTAADLGLARGRVFVMATPDDPIRLTYEVPPLVRALAPFTPSVVDDALAFGARVTDAGEFGPNPATNPNFVRLETGPSVLVERDGSVLHFDGAAGHSGYPETGSTVDDDGAPLPRTPGFNIAAVVSGLSERAVRGD